MPPKRKGITRNVPLEQELINLGVDEDELFGMSVQEQGAMYDRMQGIAPRDLATAFVQTYTDNQQQAAANAAAAMAANPPPPPPAPIAPPPAPVARPAAPIEVAAAVEAAAPVEATTPVEAPVPVEAAAPVEIAVRADPAEELIRLGVARDAVLGMTREDREFEFDRIQSLAPRVVVPPAHPAEIDAPTGPITATIEIARNDVVQEEDDPMDIDEPAPNGIVNYGRIEPNDPRRQNNWLLQQPMQPPIAAPRADEPAGPLPLTHLSLETENLINSAPNDEIRRQYLQAAVNEQWTYFMAPPPPALDITPRNVLHPDVQRMFAHLPVHLLAIISTMTVPAQLRFSLEPFLLQNQILYLRYSTLRQRREQEWTNNRARIEQDPFLLQHPELHHWLYNGYLPLQNRWLNSTHNEHLAILRENGLLAWMQQLQVLHYQSLSALEIQQLPARILQIEDIARYTAGFGDYMTWFYSAERRAWIEMMVQSGQM